MVPLTIFVKRRGDCLEYRCGVMLKHQWMYAADTLSSNHSNPDICYSSHSGDGDISSTSTTHICYNKKVKTYKAHVPRICDKDSSDDST